MSYATYWFARIALSWLFSVVSSAFDGGRSIRAEDVCYSRDGKSLAVAHAPSRAALAELRSVGVVRRVDAANFDRDVASDKSLYFPKRVLNRRPGEYIVAGTYAENHGTEFRTASEVAAQPLTDAPPLCVYYRQFEAGGVASAELSPDGRLLAVGGGDFYVGLRRYEPKDKKLLLFDLGTPEPTDAGGYKSSRFLDSADGHDRVPCPPRDLRVLAGPKDKSADVLALAFSPDGKALVSGGEDNKVRVWDVTGRKLKAGAVFDGHAAPVVGVAFAAADRLVTLDAAGHLAVREFPAGKVVKTAELAVPGVPAPAPPGPLFDAAGKQVGKPTDRRPAYRLVMAPDRQSFAVVGAGKVRVYKSDTAAEVWDVPFGDAHPSCVAFSPNSKKLCVGSAGPLDAKPAGRVEEFDLSARTRTQRRVFGE